MNPKFLSARIAWRYLRAPKSHSAVSAISIVSVVGVAVATAAIICVLSVFNGFHSLLSDRLDTLAPDILVTPSSGKVFSDADSVVNAVKSVNGVKTVMPTVTDNALAIVDTHEMPVTLRGIDPSVYASFTSIDSLTLEKGKVADIYPDKVLVSAGVAQQLGIYNSDVEMLIFAPRREGRVNVANPMASFITDSVAVADVFQAFQSEYDEKTVICDIEVARNLFQYDNEASSLEISVTPGADMQSVAKAINEKLGKTATVKDRFQQQQINFRMVSIEKWITFLLLIFILIIASFNIISTLCMLILEKQSSMATLSAIGMTRRNIGATFWWESVFVSLIGGISGIVAGLALCLLQQHFGLIKLSGDPDSLVINAYPVKVEATDIVISLLPVIVIGIITASIASAFARSRISLAK